MARGFRKNQPAGRCGSVRSLLPPSIWLSPKASATVVVVAASFQSPTTDSLTKYKQSSVAAAPYWWLDSDSEGKIQYAPAAAVAHASVAAWPGSPVKEFQRAAATTTSTTPHLWERSSVLRLQQGAPKATRGLSQTQLCALGSQNLPQSQHHIAAFG